MRFMVIVKASRDSEVGVMPSRQLLADMGEYNAEPRKAGIMQAGEGLRPSVINGPFAEAKELVGGFWL